MLFVITMVVISCKKETGTTTFIENPAKKAIDAKLVVDSLVILNYGAFEFGQKIYFSRNGKITQLGCLMASKGTFRVSLWDFATKDLIIATPITVMDTTNFTYVNVTDINVTASTRYVISINNTVGGVSRPYYLAYKKPINILSIFPFTSNSVTYESNQYKGSTTSTFPDIVDTETNYFGGIADVTFQYEE